MSPIKALYAQLITRRKPELDGWHEDYARARNDYRVVREKLKAGVPIDDPSAYTGTSFENEADPWQSFARRHLYDKENGVASRGQSVLSDQNFGRFIEDHGFRNALADIIREPSRSTYDRFASAWASLAKQWNAKNNPLLVNRIAAASSDKLSSTASAADLAVVYRWLSTEGFLAQPEPNLDWYDQNVRVMGWLDFEFTVELEERQTTPEWLSIFVWELFANIANPFTIRKQTVRYGAPGTGKTFTAKRDTETLFEAWRSKRPGIAPDETLETCRQVLQFHPSYTYEDFIEGLRPTRTVNGTELDLVNGSFKELCRRAARWELDVHGVQQGTKIGEKKWDDLTIADIRPLLEQDLGGSYWTGFADVDDGSRLADLVPPYFCIIDEINRAELSRVFGELMVCLEYRGCAGAVETQYAALNTEKTGMLRVGTSFRFFVPHNLYLIGTMNTIDRSVESFDLALRRRFRWERIDPDISALRYHLKATRAPWVNLANDLERLNERIGGTELLGSDYQIGQAYLMNLQYPDSLAIDEVRKAVWSDAIKPLLEEYLRGSGRAEALIPEFATHFGL